MKFLQISDTHLGYHQYGLSERGQDFFDVFEEAVEIAINENVDFILHSGDFFHTSRPSNEVFLKSINLIRKLKEKNIPVFVISGNHDRGNQVRDISPLKILESFGLKVVEQGSIEYEGVIISGLKYISKVAVRENGIKEILEKYLEESPDKNAKHLLMLHHEFQPFFPNSTLNLNKDIPEGFDYIGIGHYHIPQKPFDLKGSLIVYSGSTEFTAYNEKEENYPKGVHLLKYENKQFNYDFIQLNRRRPFIRIEVNDNIEDLVSILKENIEESYELSYKKPVLILKGNVKNITPKDIYLILEKENLIDKLLHINISLSTVIDSSNLEVFIDKKEDRNIEYKLKDMLNDEKLYSHVSEIISTLKSFETIDEAKAFLKENTDILNI